MAAFGPDILIALETIYFFLPDVDAYYDAVKDKAIVRWPLENMSYGTREFGVKDCNGYTLAFARRVEETP